MCPGGGDVSGGTFCSGRPLHLSQTSEPVDINQDTDSSHMSLAVPSTSYGRN